MISDAQMEKLRKWAVVDPDDTDEIENLRDDAEAAEAYLQGAGVPDSDSPLRFLVLRKLVVYWHESRGPDRQYGYPAPPPDLNALILSLRHGPRSSEEGSP